MPAAADTLSTSSLPTLNDVDVSGKRVLLRVDFNIPPLPDGGLYDDYRITATLPTIRRLIRDGARIGILTHRGRPGGRVVPELSTKPLAELLSVLLEQKVEHVPDCVGRMAELAMENLAPGQVVMFENVRFHLGEQMNQLHFVNELARLGDVFVNDAFATAHRAHASTSGLASAMEVSVAGDLMIRELEWLRKIANSPAEPVVLILGGTTVQPKIELMQSLLTKVDTVMLGGAVANTFMAARDLGMGQSMLDPSMVDAARDTLTEAGVVGCRLHLPQDMWVHDVNDLEQPAEVRHTHEIEPNESVIDIGPQTLSIWQRLIEGAGTVIMLGSVGVTENPDARAGTLGLVKTLSEQRGFNLVGGNGMLPLLARHDLRERLIALSTGGAALIDGLIGHPLPCVDALRP